MLVFNGINLDNKNKDSIPEDVYSFLGGKLILSREGEFFLLKDSIISNSPFTDIQFKSKKEEDSYSNILKWREQNKEFLSSNGSNLILTKDIKVNSPSFAGCIVKGYQAIDGWRAWKNSRQLPLDHIRKK